MTNKTVKNLNQLGGQIAQVQDEHRENRPEGQNAARLTSFLEDAESAPPRPIKKFGLPILAAAMATAVLLFFVLPFSTTTPTEFQLDGATARVNQPIHVPFNQTSVASFNDGSKVWINGDTRATFKAVTDNGAQLQISKGSAYVKVIHRENTDWKINAGPFIVNVTGTAFLVSWNPEQQTFHIQMDEGRVLLNGPTLPVGKSVGNKQHVRIQLGPAEHLIEENAGEKAKAYEKTAKKNNQALVEEKRALKTAAQKKSQGSYKNTWRDFAAQRNYKDALTAAETKGFAALCKTLSSGDLLKLADVSRFAGSAPKEEEALRAIRARFSKSKHAATATYLLGNAAFKQRKYRNAEKWNLTYLAESPNGPLAEQALGRVMEIQHQQGRATMARTTAEKYLHKYPNGTRATLARQLSH